MSRSGVSSNREPAAPPTDAAPERMSPEQPCDKPLDSVAARALGNATAQAAGAMPPAFVHIGKGARGKFQSKVPRRHIRRMFDVQYFVGVELFFISYC